MATRLLIYNVKGNFKAAAAAINAVVGLTDSYLERTVPFIKQKARIEINFDLGEAINKEVLADGTHAYDYFPGRLRFRIVTARREDQASAVDGIRDIHDEFVATILTTYEERMLPFERTDTSLADALLPYYQVKSIRPLGTRSDLDLATFSDFTDVDFAIEFGIKSTVWPTS